MVERQLIKWCSKWIRVSKSNNNKDLVQLKYQDKMNNAIAIINSLYDDLNKPIDKVFGDIGLVQNQMELVERIHLM